MNFSLIHFSTDYFKQSINNCVKVNQEKILLHCKDQLFKRLRCSYYDIRYFLVIDQLN